MPQAGDPAPNFEVSAAWNGRPMRLSWALDSCPAVLCFYRGHWRPYSNVHLSALREVHDEVRSLGAELLFIGRETLDNGGKMMRKWGDVVPVLCDEDGAAMDAFRLSYDLPDHLREDYAALGFPQINTRTQWRLPITATFIVDRLSVVRFQHAHPDYTRRIEPRAIVSAIRDLQR